MNKSDLESTLQFLESKAIRSKIDRQVEQAEKAWAAETEKARVDNAWRQWYGEEIKDIPHGISWEPDWGLYWCRGDGNRG